MKLSSIIGTFRNEIYQHARTILNFSHWPGKVAIPNNTRSLWCVQARS